jgi:Protein of unknown function (DUF2505)
MRFSVDHELPGPPADVVAVWLDPGFHERLDLPDLSRPEVVEASTAGTASVLRLRYEFTGHLDPVVRKLLGNRKLTWIQELRFDVAVLRGRLTFAAEADAKRLYGDADITLEAAGTSETQRHISGELHVRIPVIGGSGEKRIVPGLVKRLDVEAVALGEALRARE